MEAFRTICTVLGIIGKRFLQDAGHGLRDLCVESQGRKYNRAVRLCKLVYETLMTGVVWISKKWVEKKHDKKTS